MLELKRLMLLALVTMTVASATLLASQTSYEFQKVVPLGHLQFNEDETDVNFQTKTLPMLKKIQKNTTLYKEYQVELIGDTSCGQRYEKYASSVEDALLEGGIDPQKIKVTYFRFKDGGGKCAISRKVKLKLYLGGFINNDLDDDGVPNDIDKCPATPSKSIVSEDGCVHETYVVLLSGRKQHSSIVLQTDTATLVLDKPLHIVTLDSSKMISKPKKIDKKSLNKLMGEVIASSDKKQYRFVFYFTDINLEPESKKRVDTMLETISDLNGAYINIIGNTDTVGSVSDNTALGLKRAKVIADSIRKAGVQYLKMDVSSHSELDLALPTEDETKELLNRRVEVLIQ